MEKEILEMLAEVCEDDVVLTKQEIDLFETGLLDSMGFIDLILAIEEKFGLIIAPSEIEHKDLNTPQKIIALIESRQKR